MLIFSGHLHQMVLCHFINRFQATEMLVGLLNICSDDELNMNSDDSIEDLTNALQNTTDDQMNAFKVKEEKRIKLQRKIFAVAKMAKYFHNLREESEAGNLELKTQGTRKYELSGAN